jgi:hypothetical protein
MGIYRKTTPSSYPITPASNFTDNSKNWRQHKNIYRYTSGNETASLTAVPGRYTDSTRTWRRIKSIYRFTSSNTWQKVFGKFAGQPYPETPARIRYSSYTGTDVGDFAMMGPGSEAIAQGESGTTFLWGRDGQDWQNIETLASRSRTFVYSDRPLTDIAQQVTNDEGNFEGDKLRNSEAVILQYDGLYVWYRDRISTAGTSTGTSYSQTVKIIKQQPVINSLSFKTNNIVSAGSTKYITYSIANQWYRSIDQHSSVLKWYILDTQYETPTDAKLYGSTYIISTSSTETTTTLTGEDYFSIPATFNEASTTGKWLHVKLICKNSSSNTDVEYSVAPYNDVTDYIVAQITGAVPIGTNATVTMSRENTSYSVSVASGNTGTWSNTPTSYRYQWYLQEQTVGSAYTWSPISGATSSTYNAVSYKPTGTSASSRIVPVVWASNASGESNQGNALTNSGGVAISSTAGGITISNPTSNTAAMIKYKLPSITTFTITKGARKVTYVANFSADDPGVTTGTISWTGQATGSVDVGSSADTFTYQPLAAGTYNFTLTATNVSTNALTGSATATQNSIVVDDFSSYTFAFGNTFYVSTNGLIYLDVARGTQVPDGTSGRVIQIFRKDLNQGSNGAAGADGSGFLLRWSDANDYVIRWDGYIDGQAGVASYRLTYYVRFYKEQKYCDVYIQTKGANVGTPADTPGFYFDGSILGASLANPAQGSTFRIYLDGQTGSVRTDFSGELPVPADMVSAGAATGISGIYPPADEGYTPITTAANLYTSPTLTIGTVTSNATSISVPYTTGGSYAKFDIDVKTTSHSGTSISGYPKTDQTTATPISISSLSGSTTYYITITPKNSKGQLGTAQTTSKATEAAVGTFTDLTYKEMYTGGFAAVFYTVSNTTDVTNFDANATRFYPYETQTGGIVNYTASKRGFIAISFGGFGDYSNTSYKWTGQMTPKRGTTAGTTQYLFNMTSKSTGTPADLPGVTLGTVTTGDGTLSVPVTLDANASRYTAILTRGTTTVSTKYLQSSTTLSYSGLTNGSSHTVTVTPYYVYYTDPDATDSDIKTTVQFPGTAVAKTGTPAAVVAKPTISTAPAVTRDAASNYKYNTTSGTWTGSPTSYSYQWYYFRSFPFPPFSETTTISGATSSSYTSSATFVATTYPYFIYCSVVATNAGGDSSASTSNFVQITAATAALPATPSAPTVEYKSARNSRTYTWDVSYTIGTDATSMDVMNQYFTSSSGTYTSSPYDTDPTGTQSSTYDGYIEYRNFVSSKAMPLTDADGYWDNNNSWMRARVRARNASGASGWSSWSPWR